MPNQTPPSLDFVLELPRDTPSIPLARALKNQMEELSWNQVRSFCYSGRVLVDGERVRDPRRSLKSGAHIVFSPLTSSERGRVLLPTKGIHILFEDSQVVVVNKPSGLPTIPSGEGDRATVLDAVRKTWRLRGNIDPRSPLMVVQRLDRGTSGALVLARTEAARSILNVQFRAHQIERVYLALVHGIVKKDQMTIRTFIAADRGDGLRGSIKSRSGGREAITHVEVLQRLEGASLVECRLETGRTHQVRIHLSERGHPLLGEPLYVRDYEGECIEASRLMLHARTLGFRHPRTGRDVRFEARVPDDFLDLLARLGGQVDALKKAVPRREVRKKGRDERRIKTWWKETRAPRGPGRRGGEASGGTRSGTERRDARRTPFQRGEEGTGIEGAHSGVKGREEAERAPRRARRLVRPPRPDREAAREAHRRRLEEIKREIRELASLRRDEGDD